MSLANEASLIAAVAQLRVVQLVIGAIRTADISSAAAKGGASGVLGPAAVFEPRPHLHPELRIEPRRVLHPTPRIEPRIVHHPVAVCPDVIPCTLSTELRHESHITPSPIQPPWKVLPWQWPPAPALKVKVVARQPDNTGNGLYKGSVIDCFI